jgi:hypothetical protein
MLLSKYTYQTLYPMKKQSVSFFICLKHFLLMLFFCLKHFLLMTRNSVVGYVGGAARQSTKVPPIVQYIYRVSGH